MSDVNLEMLQALMQRGLEELAGSRKEANEVRAILLSLVDSQRRLERRMGELSHRVEEMKDDIELMLKAEIMGRMGHYEQAMDARVAALEALAPPPTRHG